MMYITQVIPTVQGEGRNIGKPSLLIRVGGCNLVCPYCDTAWSIKKDGYKVNDIINDCKNQKFPIKLDDNYNEFINYINYILSTTGIQHVMITGGEPFIYTDGIAKLVNMLHYDTNIKSVEFETNGTTLIEATRFLNLYKLPNKLKIHFNISPKLQVACHSVDNEDDLLKLYYKQIAFFRLNIVKFKNVTYDFKFIHHKTFETQICLFIDILHIERNNIYMMAFTPRLFKDDTGFVKNEIMEEFRDNCKSTIKFCLQNGFRYSPRDHVFVFGSDKNEVV